MGSSFLFLKVYSIPKPGMVKYRFSDGTGPSTTPSTATSSLGEELWQPLVAPGPAEPDAAARLGGLSENATRGPRISSCCSPFLPAPIWRGPTT